METIVLKNVTPKFKNALDELSNRMNMTEERISKLEDRTIEISQSNSSINRCQKIKPNQNRLTASKSWGGLQGKTSRVLGDLWEK